MNKPAGICRFKGFYLKVKSFLVLVDETRAVERGANPSAGYVQPKMWPPVNATCIHKSIYSKYHGTIPLFTKGITLQRNSVYRVTAILCTWMNKISNRKGTKAYDKTVSYLYN